MLATTTDVRCACIYCGKTFSVKASQARRGRGKMCAVRCPGRAPKHPKPPRPVSVRLETLGPGDQFSIDGRKGVVIARHLLFDAVRIKLDNRVHLWHRRISVVPIPVGCAPEIDRNGTRKPKRVAIGERDTGTGSGFLGDPTRGTNG